MKAPNASDPTKAMVMDERTDPPDEEHGVDEGSRPVVAAPELVELVSCEGEEWEGEADDDEAEDELGAVRDGEVAEVGLGLIVHPIISLEALFRVIDR